MLSFYRSGLLALTLMSGFMADVEAQVQRSSHQAWVSDVSIERLQDKSVLTEYFGESVSNKNSDVILRVGFIPRFGCAPLITFKFDNSSARSLFSVSNIIGIDSLLVSIDGAILSFPALVDEDGNQHSIYMNASLQRRITARLRVEVGSKVLLRTSNSQSVSFSLLGSRDAISIAHQNCRRHDPALQQ